MIVPLSASLRIVSSRHDWALQRSRRRKSETVWEAFKYYGTLHQALVAAGEGELRMEEGCTLADFVRVITEICQRHEQALIRALGESEATG